MQSFEKIREKYPETRKVSKRPVKMEVSWTHTPDKELVIRLQRGYPTVLIRKQEISLFAYSKPVVLNIFGLWSPRRV